jgi:methionyl aminopeptidase
MAAIIKSKGEQERIRETGRIVASILAELRTAVRPGITTGDLDSITVDALKRYGARSSSLGYHRYPKSLCTSVNDEVVHGIPDTRVLHEGDVISIDFAAVYNGWHADSAITVPVGSAAPEVRRLIKVTEDALYRGIAAARVGNRVRDISRAVQDFVEAAGLAVVRHYGGHGVGRSMHEDPDVMNYVEPGQIDHTLTAGMVIAIEPMVTLGAPETRMLEDDWTIVTLDGSYAAHFEHTVAITEGDAEILTL